MVQKVKVFVLLLLLSVYIYGADVPCNDPSCEEILNKFYINKNIKTPVGWIRVCNNNMIQRYSKIKLTGADKRDVCRCFNNYIDTTRSFEDTNIRGY